MCKEARGKAEEENKEKESKSKSQEKKSARQENTKVGGTSTTKMGADREDATLKLLVFHGTGMNDAEQHWFTCKVIWAVKQMLDDQANIAQLERTFRKRALTWYMNFKATTPTGQVRTLTEIKQALLKEFQKPKSESQCITEIKEIKQITGELLWDVGAGSGFSAGWPTTPMTPTFSTPTSSGGLT